MKEYGNFVCTCHCDTDEEVERGFCSVCGSTLFWHNPADNHYCMNAELFDDIIKNAVFGLELFYDMKPEYYSFAGERKKLDRDFEEISEDTTAS